MVGLLPDHETLCIAWDCISIPIREYRATADGHVSTDTNILRINSFTFHSNSGDIDGKEKRCEKQLPEQLPLWANIYNLSKVRDRIMLLSYCPNVTVMSKIDPFEN